MQIPQEELFGCECEMELMRVQYDEDFSMEPDAVFYFSIYHYGKIRYSWKRRLEQLWLIMSGQGPYADNIILKESEAKRLADHINNKINNNTKTRYESKSNSTSGK